MLSRSSVAQGKPAKDGGVFRGAAVFILPAVSKNFLDKTLFFR
jgi:hypothetical protein